MEQRSPFDWIQLITLIGIFVGLGLVVFEMRQNQVLTRAQIASDAWGEALAEDRAIMGENPAPVIAKSCAGEPLSKAETVQLQAYLNHLMRRYERMDQIDAIADFGYGLEGAAYELARQFIGVPYGRYVQEEYGGQGFPSFQAALDEVIANDDTAGSDYCER